VLFHPAGPRVADRHRAGGEGAELPLGVHQAGAGAGGALVQSEDVTTVAGQRPPPRRSGGPWAASPLPSCTTRTWLPSTCGTPPPSPSANTSPPRPACTALPSPKNAFSSLALQ